jgi:hypothetical protein
LGILSDHFFMTKIILKIFLIIFVNLLAFLCVWFILDALFETGGIAVLTSILVSLPVLGIIMYRKAGGILQDLQKNSHK